jgi:steroid delta-isomerase-like uncharacterized protein
VKNGVAFFDLDAPLPRVPSRAMRSLTISTVLMVLGCGGSDAPKPPPSSPPNPAVSSEPTAPPVTTPAPTPTVTKLTMAEMQKRTSDAMLEAFNAHDAKKLSVLYAENATIMSWGAQGTNEHKGRQHVEKGHAALFDAFPDLRLGYVRVFYKGNLMVQEWIAAGTQKKPFAGMPNTGKEIGFRAASVYHFDDAGLIRVEHNYMDEGTIAGQLGLTKEKVRPLERAPSGSGQQISGDDEEKNVQIARDFYASIEKNNEKTLLTYLTDDVVHIAFNEPEDHVGKNAAKKELLAYGNAFPDLKVPVHEIWAIKDFVIAERSIMGTHKGPIGNLKPTGKPVEVHGLGVIQMRNGKVWKVWSYQNNLEVQGQLGLLAPKK